MAQGQAKRFGKKGNARFEDCVLGVKATGKPIGLAHQICNSKLPTTKKAKKK